MRPPEHLLLARDTDLDDPQMRKQFKMLEYHADPGAQFRSDRYWDR